jgi:hypothetical protein
MLTLIAWCWTTIAAAQEGAPADEELPPDEAPPLEADAPLEREEPEPVKLGMLPGPWVGASVGVASPTSVFDPGGLLRIDAGYVPVKLRGRLQPIAALTLSSPKVAGVVDENEGEHITSYEANQRTTTALAGLNVRLFPPKQLIAPEIGAAPAFVWTRTRVQGSIDGASFSPTSDTSGHLALVAWAGLTGRVGNGQLAGQLSWCRIGLKSPITGDGHLTTVTPTIGYRMTL